MRPLPIVLLACTAGWAQPISQLWQRGYSVIPAPRAVRLAGGEILLDDAWKVDAGLLGDKHVAVQTLLGDAAEFHGLALKTDAGGRIRLAVKPGAVATRAEADCDRQAYRLRVSDAQVEITGNSDQGLFYGVQTLLQLIRRDAAGRLRLPRGEIEDWPRLALRFLHWDTKHHQDRLETLKRYLDWTARFKANMIAFELEDKFEYPSHPVIGAPGAFTAAQLQELVDYGRERFIQIVPDVQAPAHMAYVLKHPQFAPLRADGNNYQSALCDPRTYQLIFAMYDDLVRATRGVDYFFVSTDEVYYAGIESQCTRPYNPVHRSLTWVEFVRKARDFLHSRGRRILVWAEYPLLPEHVPMIPPDVIDGVIGEEEYLEAENKLGMRQLGYVSMQGSELLFPDHLPLEGRRGRLEQAFEYLHGGRYWRGRPIGVFGAAWDDSGLHNETFWLGWSAVAQWGWNPGAATPEQHATEFMRFYYGPQVGGLIEIYRTLQRQARAWEQSWERVISRVRGPGYGNSYGKGRGTARYDLTLDPPPLPELPDLRVTPRLAGKYAERFREAPARALENDRLAHALQENFARAERNHYNLEVLLALARFIGNHWRLLGALASAERSLEEAAAAAGKKDPARAVGHLVAAHNTIAQVRRRSEQTFAELTAVYEKSRFPKGQSVGGRKFVHVLDDTKDHWADRTPDLSFMMAPERSIGLDEWRKELSRIIRTYAAEHNVPVRGLAEQRLEE